MARQLGAAKSTVSRWAKADDLSFDRAQTAQAVAAKSIDLTAGRQLLAEKMLAASETMIDKIDEPYAVFNFGGKDNTFESETLDSAPADIRRNVITTAGITFDKLTRIVEKDTTSRALSRWRSLSRQASLLQLPYYEPRKRRPLRRRSC